MTTEQHVDGGWNRVKGEAKQKWGDLNDDELHQFEGNLDEFIGFLQQRTGDAHAEIERWIADFRAEAQPLFDRVAELTRGYTEGIASGVSDTAARARDGIAGGRAEAAAQIRKKPTQSIAMAFGVGVLAGAVIGLLSRPKS